ncbi:Fc.00g100400.m01.CDS01 [Cosmosporella sp. VM-42]
MAQALWPEQHKQKRSTPRPHRPRRASEAANDGAQAFSKPRRPNKVPPTKFRTNTIAPSNILAKPDWESYKAHRAKEGYLQWGYIRHQSPKEEVLSVRRKFNSWRKKMRHVQFPKDPSSWPWRDDGKWVFELEGVSEMRKAWEQLDVRSRQQKWPTVMLSTLHLCPDKAIQVLNATFDPLPPGYAIHSVLQYVVRRLKLSNLPLRERSAKAEEVLEIFARAVESVPSRYVPFKQATLGVLCRKLPRDHVVEFYQILRRAHIRLHHHTLLHIASRFAAHPSTKDMAFEILRDIANQNVNLNQSHYSSVITTLLHSTHEAEGWTESETSFSPQGALQYFIEKGFSPNIINFTALLETLCKQGDIAEAIRLPLLLAETGVSLDARCYTTVFRGAKDSLKAENMKGAFDVAKAANVPYVDVLNNALHSIFYFAEMESREKKPRVPWATPTFGTMLRIYAKKFDLEPLQWLLQDTLPLVLAQDNQDGTEKFKGGNTSHWEFKETIVPVVEEFFSGGPNSRVQPNSTTLAIMLRAYIRSLHRPYDLISFYTFFKSRIEECGEDSRTAQLIKDQGSIIHDTLIMVMFEHRVLLRPALQVFGDMLRDAMKSKTPEAGQESVTDLGSTPVHPAPSYFTFSIVIHGLMMQGNKMMAEQVLQVMRERGLEPNLVTWNTLIKGYAHMQHVPRTVGTLQDLEAVGFKPDVSTFKAFSRLKDQTKALEMMEDIIDANKKKMERDLQLSQ